jgi:hypothetical protein
MKATACAAYLAAVIIAGGAIFAYAQSSQPQSGGHQVIVPASSASSYYEYPYGYQFSSTPGEGFARGMADVIRAQGDYNLSTSAAAVNVGEARRREIDNAKQWTQTYFDMREINRQQFLAEQQRLRGNPDQLMRYHSTKQNRLSPSDLDSITGEIHWPVLLTAEEYATQRDDLQKAFALRAQNGAMNADDLLRSIQVTDDLLAMLRSRVRDLPADKYMAAKRFIEALVAEAGLPVG